MAEELPVPVGDVLIDGLINPGPKKGPFAKGFGVGVQNLKSAGGGLISLAGRGVGSRAIEQVGANITAAANEAAAPDVMTVEQALEPEGSLVDLAKYAAGNVLPSLGVSLAGGLLGRGVGALAARGAAPATVAKVKDLGLALGAGATSVGMEAGQIFPEAVQEGVESPVARSLAGGVAAGALDTAVPLLLMRRLGLFGDAALKPRKPGYGALAKGTAAGAAGIAVTESGTEVAQSVIERIAAGQPVTGKEAMSDYLNAAVIGLFGGALPGAAGGAVGTLRRPLVQAPAPFTKREQDSDVNTSGVPPETVDLADLPVPQPAAGPLPAVTDPREPATPVDEPLLTTEEALAGANINPAIKPKTETPVSDVVQTTPLTAATVAAETAVAKLKKDQGFLLSKREIQLLAPTLTPAEAVARVQEGTGRAPREVSKQVPEKTRQGAIEEATTRAVAPNIDAVVTAKNLKPEPAKKLKRTLTDALHSIAQEAAKLEPAAAKAHIIAEVPRALKGRVLATDAQEVAQTMAAAVDQASTYYSKGGTGAYEVGKGGEVKIAGQYIGRVDRLPADARRPNQKWYYVTHDAGKSVATATKQEAIDQLLAQHASTQESNAGITAEEFLALSPEAQAAAIDYHDKVLTERGQQLIARMKQLLGDRPELSIRLFTAAPDSTTVGSYTRLSPFKSLISLALNAKNELSIADHEGFHAAEDMVLDARERAIVRNALQPNRPLFKKLLESVRAYDLENNTNLADEILSKPAEARAYGFEFWKRGELRAEGGLQQVFQKIRDFLAKSANFIQGQGFQSIEDIFTALDRGQYAERQTLNENGIGGLAAEFASQAAQARWYKSALIEQVAALAMKVATPNGWRDALKGLLNTGLIRQTELDAVGLPEYLDLQEGKITKEQIAQFVRENGVRVEETVLGAPPARPPRQVFWTPTDTTNNQKPLQIDNALSIIAPYSHFRLDVENGRAIWADENGTPVPEADAIEIAKDWFDYYEARDKGAYLPKFGAYQLPGGQNYRELLLTYPGSDAATREQAEFFPKTGDKLFRSSHFDQPNILAHIRFNDRTDADGKRVLFLEEIQSDWAQKGKKEGFIGKFTEADAARKAELEAMEEGGLGLRDELLREWSYLDSKQKGTLTIPSAPFVTKTEAWVGLALKRMIHYAVENGYERIAWTTGEQQAARYDLSKHVENIGYIRRGGLYNVTVWGKGGKQLWQNQSATLQQVEETVGKEIAAKMQNNEGTKATYGSELRYFTGLDLKVGGEGMKAFYDKIVPNVANDILKKLGGGKVGQIALGGKAFASKNADSDEQLLNDLGIEVKGARPPAQPGFDITDQIAVRATGGLTLFSRAAVEMDRRYKHGELEQEQLQDAVAAAIDAGGVAKPTLQQAFGAGVAEAGGSLQRWRLKWLATGNYIARLSTGYANVQKVLMAYSERKAILITEWSKVGLSTWHTASQADRDTVGVALLERSHRAYLDGSREYNNLIQPLTEQQRRMFNQATANNLKMLDEEHTSRIKVMQQVMPEEQFKEWLDNEQTRLQRLKAEGYVPFRRYGDHTVYIYKDIVGKDGKAQRLTVHYDLFEHESEAVLATNEYAEMLKRVDPDLKVERGYKHKVQRDTSGGIQQFLDTARRHGVEITQIEKERLAKALVSADSMQRNRIFRRKNVPGYSQDIFRVMHEFVATTANRVSYNEFGGLINDAAAGKTIARLPDGSLRTDEGAPNLWDVDGLQSGFYRNLSDELLDYVLVPDQSGQWSAKLRGAAMYYFLGGSIAAGAVNAMSVPMNVVPWLSMHTDYANAMTTTLSAWKTTWASNKLLRDINVLKDFSRPISGISNELRQALIAAAEDGTTMDTEIHQIMGMAQGSLLAKSRRAQRAAELWMSPFRLAEQTNRITAFIAAYRIGTENKLTGRELYDFAKGSVKNTQNDYSEVNRPGVARHPVWAMLFMFKSYPMFMLEMIEIMYRQNPKSAVYMLLGLVAMTGVTGLPFAEPLQDLIDTISQKLFNSPFNTRRAVRNWIKDASEAITGADHSELVLRGLINEMTGLNVASRIGLGDFVPGTRVGTADSDYGRVAEQLLGAPVAMLTGGLPATAKAIGAAVTLDYEGFLAAVRQGGPSAVRNLIKGAEQLDRGYAEDAKGRKLVDVTGPYAFWQSLGFSSAGLHAAYEKDRIEKQTLAFYTQVRGDMLDEMVKAIKNNDPAKAQEVQETITAWNAAYPDQPLGLNAATVRRQIALAGLTLNARTIQMLPRALRGTALAEGIENP